MNHHKLTDTQLMLLSVASQREDLLLMPPVTLKGGALKATVSKLLIQGLVREVPTRANDAHWLKDAAVCIDLKLTSRGLAAIGLEPDGIEAQPDDSAAGSAEPASGRGAEQAPHEGGGDGPPPPASKQAKVLALLAREEGATLDDLVRATGWLPHTTRAALTGLRHKGHVIDRMKAADGRSVYRTPRGEA